MERISKKLLIAAVLLLVAVIAALPIADLASGPAAYQTLTSSLDSKVETVLKLTSTSTVASLGISAIPGDTATPIAQKLADLSAYFLMILCVLYTEKYLLAILGVAVFRVMIPCACVLAIIALFARGSGWRRLAVKLTVLGLALYFAIPVCISLSDMIYRNYETAIESTVQAAEDLTEETGQLTNAGEDRNILQSILNAMSESASSLSNKAASILSRFVETIAVMIVTSCIMPLLGLAFILWVVKLLMGTDAFGSLLPPPKPHRRHEENT